MYFHSLAFGLFISTIYVSFFALPTLFGFKLQDYQTGRMSACAPVGSGIIPPLIGFIMNSFHIDYLFVSQAFLAISMLLLYLLTIR